MLVHQNPQPRMPERVVVIGTRGVIGRALCDRMARDGVPCLPVSSVDIDLLEADAADRLSERLTSADALVMLSALTPDKGRDRATLMKNFRMAHAVGTALDRQPVAHVVYFSSDAVYPMGSEVVTEESCAAPTDLYGTMHRTREVMLADAAGDAPLAILRCTLVCATGDTHNSYGPNRFRRQAAKEGTITLGGKGEEQRDYIHVEDVVETILRVLLHRSAGVLNLATGRSFGFDQVARLVADCFDPPAQVVHTDRQAPITHRHFDITALHRAFPDLRYTPIEEAIRRVHTDDIG